MSSGIISSARTVIGPSVALLNRSNVSLSRGMVDLPLEMRPPRARLWPEAVDESEADDERRLRRNPTFSSPSSARCRRDCSMLTRSWVTRACLQCLVGWVGRVRPHGTNWARTDRCAVGQAGATATAPAPPDGRPTQGSPADRGSDRVAGPHRRAVAGSARPLRPRGRRWPAGSTAGAARACGIGSWPSTLQPEHR
jgi:hypothetical protein